jgi:hypothetical protein
MTESVDRRILGAFVCVDVITGSSIPGPLLASNPTWTLRPNRSGIFVIFDGPGFDAQTNQFVPVGTWPTAVPFEVTIEDPQNRYLPRRANVKAPQAVPTVTSANKGTVIHDSTTVFDPQPVKLYPTAATPVSPNWAVIFVSVVRSGVVPVQGLPWAYVQVNSIPAGTSALAEGVTGSNGDSILAVRGLSAQVSSSSGGPLTETKIPVTVQAWFDPSVLQQPAGWVSNPQDISGNLTSPNLRTNSQNESIGAGQIVSVTLAISV